MLTLKLMTGYEMTRQNSVLVSQTNTIIKYFFQNLITSLWMEDFHAEDCHDIISIQILLPQYGNDFKWIWVTHGIFTKCLGLLDKEKCA